MAAGCSRAIPGRGEESRCSLPPGCGEPTSRRSAAPYRERGGGLPALQATHGIGRRGATTRGLTRARRDGAGAAAAAAWRWGGQVVLAPGGVGWPRGHGTRRRGEASSLCRGGQRLPEEDGAPGETTPSSLPPLPGAGGLLAFDCEARASCPRRSPLPGWLHTKAAFQELSRNRIM